MLSLQHLPNQRSGETIIHFLRKHPIVFIMPTLFYGGLMLAPIILYTVAVRVEPEFIDNLAGRELLHPFLLVVLFVYWLSVWLFYFQAFLDYYLDVWVLTNMRILNIQQASIFVRRISELPLDRIQDVTSEIEGVVPTLLNYGTMEVQTAGEQELFVFTQLPYPYKVRDEILNAMDAFIRSRPQPGQGQGVQ